MPLPRTSDAAAQASNWRAVLLADAAVGLVAVVAGLALIAVGHPVAFALVVAGVAYFVLVIRRWRRWRRLRAAAGRR